jgi:hypothetical protein
MTSKRSAARFEAVVPGRVRFLVVVTTVVGLALAGLAWWHSGARVERATSARPLVAARGAAPASMTPSVAASTKADVDGNVLSPMKSPRLPEESAAESLRKVQLGLEGSPEQALVAAQTLQACALAQKEAEAYYQVRDRVGEVPPEVKKAFGSSDGALPKEAVDGILRNQRRCQVFDAVTLSRQGELFLKAYEGGARGAALPYLQWLVLQSPRPPVDQALLARAQADTRQAARSGDIATLAAFAYAQGGNAKDLGADAIEAHAYREAYFRILEDGAPDNAARDRVAKFSRLLPPEPALTASQQQAADALVTQLLAAHRQGIKDNLAQAVAGSKPGS